MEPKSEKANAENVQSPILPKEIQDLIDRKDARIKELETKVAALEKEKEDIVDNFQTSTEVLLERIKDLETSALGARPQTANILARIGIFLLIFHFSSFLENSVQYKPPENEISNKNHNYYVGSAKADILTIDHPPENNSPTEIEEIKGAAQEEVTPGMSKCTNCGELISSNKMVTHTVSCYRNSTKCKICGERLLKSKKTEHLAYWRSLEKIQSAISNDDEEELTLILDHGVEPEHRIEPNGKTLLHLCADKNANDCLLLLISRGADTDPSDETGCTPLLLALQKSNKKTAASLIELGANIECKYFLKYGIKNIGIRQEKRL